jgi:signal transduction histidine kinase
MRMLGSLIWFMIPIFSIMLIIPHENPINYEMTLLLLFCIFVVNFATLLLPLRESPLTRYFGLYISLYSVSMIGLTCAGIHFSGGIRSPLFVLLLLVTAFSTSLFSSLRSAVLISVISVGGYLATILVFSALYRENIQYIGAQIFFLFLITFFINRLGVESREQLQEKEKAIKELRTLSEMDRAASGFVSAVSFEMRTPLTSILGFSEMLVNRQIGQEKEHEYVKIISREADNLSRLVEDLLDISRLESGRINLNKEETRLDLLLKGSLPILQPICDPSQVVINIPPGFPGIMVDPKRMKRVFDSICGYIVRRSSRGSEVRASAKTEGPEVVLTINTRNRAATIPQGEGGRLFPPPASQDEEDLELAMARRIILAHKGSINLIQASGGWFTIVIRLPESMAYELIKATSPSLGTFEENPA